MPISTINQNGLNAPLTLTAPVLGTPASINLANATNLPKAALPAGLILQVVQATKTDVWSTNSGSGQWIDIPGQGGSGTFQVQITPSSASSRILVMAQIYCSSTSNQVVRSQLRRNNSAIFTGDAAGSRPLGWGQTYFNPNAFGGQNNITLFNLGGVYVDSPSSTSVVTYKIVLGADNTSGSAEIRLNQTNRDSDQSGYDVRGASSIIVMEIKG